MCTKMDELGKRPSLLLTSTLCDFFSSSPKGALSSYSCGRQCHWNSNEFWSHSAATTFPQKLANNSWGSPWRRWQSTQCHSCNKFIQFINNTGADNNLPKILYSWIHLKPKIPVSPQRSKEGKIYSAIVFNIIFEHEKTPLGIQF